MAASCVPPVSHPCGTGVPCVRQLCTRDARNADDVVGTCIESDAERVKHAHTGVLGLSLNSTSTVGLVLSLLVEQPYSKHFCVFVMIQ